MNELSFGTRNWPTEVRLKKAERVLEIDFDDGSSFALPAELLRVESPSADVQGHAPDEKQVIGGCRTVGIVELQAIGNYAIGITFDDGHDTGIYSWDYLYHLGTDKERLMREYVENLMRLGLSRDDGPAPAPAPKPRSGGCGGGSCSCGGG